MGSNSYVNLSCLHVIVLKALLCSLWSWYTRCMLDSPSICGVIVVDADSISLLILNVMHIYMIIALDIVMIICSSINCPTVICLPTVYYLREKPLVNTMAPGVYFIIIAKTLYHFVAIYFVLFRSSIYNLNLTIDHRKIDNLSFALGARVCCLCTGAALRCVAWFSYWFDNFGFITEGNTWSNCIASSSPLGGNTNARLHPPSHACIILSSWG
jgi:hypothetical protein